MPGLRSAVKGCDAWSPSWASPENEELINRFARNQARIHRGCSSRTKKEELIEENKGLRDQILGHDHSRVDKMNLETLARHMSIQRQKDAHVYGNDVPLAVKAESLARSVTAADLSPVHSA